MYTGRAFIAGVIGALAMSLVMVGLNAGGLGVHVESRLANVIGLNAWIVGLIIYLLIGGLVGIIYACVFEWILNEGGVGAGLLTAACHTILAGFVWETVSGPGPFWMRFGAAGIASLFLIHFVYGAIVGGMYHTKHVLVQV